MTEEQNQVVETGQALADKAGEAVRDLFFQHWPEIQDAMGDEVKMPISFPVTLRPDGRGYRIDTKIGFTKSYKDEREDYVDDPRQTTFTDGL